MRAVCGGSGSADGRVLQRKANGVALSIDAGELDSMSDEQLRRRYDAEARGSAGVPGAHGEDFSDMVAKEMAGRQKKQKLADSRRGGSSKEFKF